MSRTALHRTLCHLCTLVAMLACRDLIAKDDEATIVVTSFKIEWRGVLNLKPPDWSVFANGEKIGTIGFDVKETKTFKYQPARNGENVIIIAPHEDYDEYKKWYEKMKSSIAGIELRAQRLQFKAAAGSKTELNIDWDSVVGRKLIFKSTENSPARPTAVAKQATSVTLDKKLKKKIIKESPPIRLARGTEKVVEDNFKIVRSVTISNGWNAGVEVKGKVKAIWAEAELGIRAGIEQTESKTYGTEEWLKRSVTLKGDGTPRMVKVVWVEYYRTGTAKVMVDGKEIAVPFEFKEDFDLLTEDADEE